MKSIDYDKPVMCSWLSVVHPAQVQTVEDVKGAKGQTTAAHYFTAPDYCIQLHLRQNYVRVWCGRLNCARVTNIKLGEGSSWQIEGEAEERSAPGPVKAA